MLQHCLIHRFVQTSMKVQDGFWRKSLRNLLIVVEVLQQFCGKIFQLERGKCWCKVIFNVSCYNVPFSSLRFFPRHIHDFLHNTLFLRSVNRFVRNLVLPSCLFSCYFDKMLHHFVPYAVLSCSAIKTPYRIMRRIVMW